MIESDNPKKLFPQENHIFDLDGFLRTLTEEPTHTPKKFSDQLVIVTTGGSSALYIYDTSSTSWMYTALT